MQPRPSWFEMSDHLAAGIAPARRCSLMNGHVSAARAGPAGVAAIARRRTKQETRQRMIRIGVFQLLGGYKDGRDDSLASRNRKARHGVRSSALQAQQNGG